MTAGPRPKVAARQDDTAAIDGQCGRRNLGYHWSGVPRVGQTGPDVAHINLEGSGTTQRRIATGRSTCFCCIHTHSHSRTRYTAHWNRYVANSAIAGLPRQHPAESTLPNHHTWKPRPSPGGTVHAMRVEEYAAADTSSSTHVNDDMSAHPAPSPLVDVAPASTARIESATMPSWSPDGAKPNLARGDGRRHKTPPRPRQRTSIQGRAYLSTTLPRHETTRSSEAPKVQGTRAPTVPQRARCWCGWLCSTRPA